MKLNFNTVNNEERGCGQRSVIWLKRSQPCLNHLCVLIKTFSWWPLSLFSLWIIILLPSLPPPFILPLINQCDRCLARLAWGLTAGGCGFASHGGVTLVGAGCAKSGSPLTSLAPTSTKRHSCCISFSPCSLSCLSKFPFFLYSQLPASILLVNPLFSQ